MKNNNRHSPHNPTHNFKLIRILKSIKLEDWREIQDIGPVVAKSIYEYFQDKDNLKFINKLLKIGVQIEEPKKRKALGDQRLAGKTFVFTGGLKTLTRDEAKNLVRELDGEISESVSKKTSYVVVGAEPGEKYDDAKKLGVKTITEKEFLEMVK